MMIKFSKKLLKQIILIFSGVMLLLPLVTHCNTRVYVKHGNWWNTRMYGFENVFGYRNWKFYHWR